MSVGIIDYRRKRRQEMRDWLVLQAFEVNDANTRSDFQFGRGLDLLLFHVGEAQRKEGDNLEAVIAEFSANSWVVGYSGSWTAIEEFRNSSIPGFAVFRQPVTSFDEDFKMVIVRVLRELPSRKVLPPNWLREAVTEFDPELERKLTVLVSVLKGQQPSIEANDATGVLVPADMIDLTNPRGSSERLRKTFFGS